MRRSKITTEQIIENFRSIHGDMYNYDLVEYKTMHTKVVIQCSIHGEFKQTPNAHIRQNQGCPKCAITYNVQKQKDTTKDFILKAKEIHGNRYDYSKVEYGNNAHDKVIIICKEHGEFLMSPNSHLSKKSNCIKCARKSTGWTKTSWKNSCKGKVAKLYIIECYNEEERFIKIGITNKDTIRQRFYHKSLMPYKYKILRVIESRKDPIYIYDLERVLHKFYKDYKYTPKIKFSGDTECFSKLPKMYNII